MAGLGSRFTDFGFKTQKFLLPVDCNETTMIYKAVKTLNAPKNTNYTFVTQKKYDCPLLRKSLKEFNPYWVILEELTDGPATTAFLGLPNDDNDNPIIVSNSDQILDNWDCTRFIELCKGYDGGVLTYTPSYPITIGMSDKNSYVQLEKGECVKFAEKVVLSEHALIGVHYFRNQTVFREAYKDMIDNQNRSTNGEYYLSLMYNSVLKSGGKVCNIPMLSKEKAYLTGVPSEYFNYINNVTQYGPVKIPYFDVQLPDIRARIVESRKYDVTTATLFFFTDEEKYGDVYIAKEGIVDVENKTLVVEYEGFSDIPGDKFQKIANISETFRGWSIGDFEPSIYKTKMFEVGVLLHKQGEQWPYHIHDTITECNYLVYGEMRLSGRLFSSGDCFNFYPGHPAIPEFLSDCLIICVKYPSIPKDKRVI